MSSGCAEHGDTLNDGVSEARGHDAAYTDGSIGNKPDAVRGNPEMTKQHRSGGEHKSWVGRVVQRDRLAQQQDGPLRRCVSGSSRLTDVAADRADIHHVAAQIAAQMTDTMLDREENTAEIDRHQRIPFLRRVFVEGFDVHDSRAIHQNL